MIEFEQAGIAILNPFESIWLSFIGVLPSLIAAILLIVLGYLLGSALGHVLKVALHKIGIEKRLHNSDVAKAIGRMNLSSLFGELLKWYVFIIFLQAGVDLLELGTLSVVLTSFVNWLPQLIVAVVIILFGILVAQYVEVKIRQHSNVKGVKASAVILKWVIVFVVILSALKQIGVETSLFENAFYLIIGALAIGLALALGIGLGMGMRKGGDRLVQKLTDSF